MCFCNNSKSFLQARTGCSKKVVEKNILDSFELIDYQRFVDMLNLQRESYPKEWEGVIKNKDNEKYYLSKFGWSLQFSLCWLRMRNDIFIAMDMIQ